MNLRIGSGSRRAKSGTFTRSGISARAGRGVEHRLLALDLLPLEADLVAVDVEALAVLPGGVEQAARHLGDRRRCRGS